MIIFFQVTSNTLDSELQQLGLPKEHAAAFSKVYSECQGQLHLTLRNSRGINCSGGNLEFDVEVKGLEIAGLVEPIVQLSCSSAEDSKKFCLSLDQLNIFIQELSEAKQIMSSLS